MTTLHEQKRIGVYELRKLLGEGGMGAVWLAQDTFADRPVALKFIKPHLLADAGFRTRFINEARTLGKLEHDRIVTLYAVLEEGDHLALVLRFIDGKALSDKIDEQGALPTPFILKSARDILPALDFAHNRGIIHRDIKPQNILVDQSDRSFLTDFGIAVAAFAERGTVTGHAIGTPHYMSPEQIRTPREVCVELGGHRSDIYSYGIVLFEMLTGEVPFGHDSGMEDMYSIYQGHCTEIPRSPRALNPSVPAAFDEIVLQCLAKEPAERPQSCVQLLALLEMASADGRGRAKTVVEPIPGTGAVVPSPKPPTPIVPPPAGLAKRFGRTAWLGIGAAVVCAGVGYTIHTATPKPASPVVQQKQPDSTSTTQPQPIVKPKNIGGPSGRVPQSTPVTYQPQSNQPNLAAQEYMARLQAQKEKADKEYSLAHSEFQAGDYCKSWSNYNAAWQLYKDASYAEEREAARKGCDAP